MSERENLGAGVYAALSALLVLLCLVGALLLPPWLFSSKWLGILALAGFFIGIPLLLRAAHRSRIREAIEKDGGAVIRIRKLPFWRQPFTKARYAFFLGQRHEVDYVDLVGNRHRALCNSGLFQGVVWLEDVVIDKTDPTRGGP
jgi:hypothetical protein